MSNQSRSRHRRIESAKEVNKQKDWEETWEEGREAKMYWNRFVL